MAEKGFIKLLGTAGARFVMIRQLRSSAGMWIRFKSTNLIIDPGPGALIRCSSSRPKLDPGSLDGIILTHKHLDHSGDVNVMIEAMCEGGSRKKGVLFVPSDAVGQEGVIFSYLKGFLKEMVFLKEGNFSVGDIRFQVPVKNIHSVQTYGLKFFLDDTVVGIVSDTKYFEKLIKAYHDATILILNVVFYQKRSEFEHLCLEEALELIKAIRPQKAVITHFGMSMLKAKPHRLQEKIKSELNMDIRFAYDGMTLPFA